MTGEPISYLALAVGTPVESSVGEVIGTVAHVLQLPQQDLFDGIVIRARTRLRFVDRDQIVEIRTDVVRTSLSKEEAAALPAPQGTADYHTDPFEDTGPSLSARLGRLFGREGWKKDD